MNRTDRLFAITVLLQTRKRVRAKDLAQLFEVSERTIYRDMLALNESGIPIVSLPGEGYELVEGFALPPIRFTPSEARAIFLSGRMLSAHSAGSLNTATHSALAKIALLLPEETRAYVEQLAEGVQFFASPARFDIDDPRLVLLQQAIRERRVVWVRYYPPPAEPHVVRVQFRAKIVRWVRERQHYAFREAEELPAGTGSVMTYRVDDLEEMKAWLLSWGAAAEVLEPVELRRMVLQEAENLINLLT